MNKIDTNASGIRRSVPSTTSIMTKFKATRALPVSLLYLRILFFLFSQGCIPGTYVILSSLILRSSALKVELIKGRIQENVYGAEQKGMQNFPSLSNSDGCPSGAVYIKFPDIYACPKTKWGEGHCALILLFASCNTRNFNFLIHQKEGGVVSSYYVGALATV